MSPPGHSLKRRRTEGLEETPLKSFDRPVSPPPLRRSATTSEVAVSQDDDREAALREFFRTPVRQPENEETVEREKAHEVIYLDSSDEEPTPQLNKGKGKATETAPRIWASPFQLTTIRDLPETENVDTVGISDILGDVMLREVWVFNYCIDIPWVMAQFDPDILEHVHVNFVHGNWKREDPSKLMMEEECKRYAHAKSISAYMPEPFGTHHSKILVLFRRDDHAQVIIHTANMIAFDWTNMTQGVWRSPLLLVQDSTGSASTSVGASFKSSLLAYFHAYGKSRTGPLVRELSKYSFKEVRAIFVGSVPGKHSVSEGRFGWPALQKALSSVPSQRTGGGRPKIVAQCSSIATLGQKDNWLSPIFFKTLSTASRSTASEHLSGTKDEPQKPESAIVFPTVNDIKDSLNGYASGSAVHARVQSAAQQKQYQYMRPLLHRWSSSVPSSSHGSDGESSIEWKSAGRDCAAPHIKTYVRFSDSFQDSIDWALLSSANMSTQAWGAAPVNGEARVCSYEAGVLVHPSLWGEDVRMVPCFLRDAPKVEIGFEGSGVVGFRMPYSLPLHKYTASDEIWVKTNVYEEPDWLGQQWGVNPLGKLLDE